MAVHLCICPFDMPLVTGGSNRKFSASFNSDNFPMRQSHHVNGQHNSSDVGSAR